MTTILEARNITKKYGAMAAVDKVSLSVREGTIHSVIGPNGAGKTTFFNVLSRVTPTASGTIVFRGADITHVPLHRVASLGIGRSFQRTQVFPELTTFENVRLAAQSRGSRRLHPFRFPRSGDENNQVTRQVLDTVGLTARAKTNAAVLSHGEQRALDVAMALASKPALLLLDEPTAGMSASEVSTMTHLITRLRNEYGVTILLVEHNINLVMSISEVITVFHRGKVLAEDAPEAIRANPAVRTAYLGGAVDA